MINIIYIFLCFFIVSCSSTKEINSSQSIPPKLPPYLQDLRIPPPPQHIPQVYQIQINSSPMPYLITHSYTVHVNGKKIPLNFLQIEELAKSLNLPLTPHTITNTENYSPMKSLQIVDK